MRRLAVLGAAFAAAAALSGCGKVGQLERPGPMFGHAPAPTDADAPPPPDPNRPVKTVDPRDRSDDAAPTLTAPDQPQ
ncbi:MAG: hypothetical protein GC203_21300 [Phenylobacterium sp.]|nr:hypothetical protein [Phenylobacterium sp.]